MGYIEKQNTTTSSSRVLKIWPWCR